MMDPPVHPATSGLPSTSPTTEEDNNTVVTPTRGERAKTNYDSRVEKTIKFRFVPTNDNNDSVHPAILHAHWMYEVKKSFGEEGNFLTTTIVSYQKRTLFESSLNPIASNSSFTSTAIQSNAPTINASPTTIESQDILSTGSAHQFL
jgi:hypothetical protein